MLIRLIGFTFDGTYLVGGSEEGSCGSYSVPLVRYKRGSLIRLPLGSGIDVIHTETGELVHTFKTAGPCEAVAWSPTRYCLAYGDLGVLRIIDADKKPSQKS